jgi:hypothetical protein
MRLLDVDSDKAFSRLTLLLTKTEAAELRDSLNALLATRSGHEHVTSESFEKEITIGIYSEGKSSGFDDRIGQLIKDDR